jgi:hypothetical protein
MKTQELIEALQKVVAEHPEVADQPVRLECSSSPVQSVDWRPADGPNRPSHIMLWD